jgi:sugar/nucleoside kinase (ribokinase family)
MILTIGDVMTDVIVKPSAPVAPASDTPATIRTLPGGSAANQAVWIARFGAPVAFCGRVNARDVAAVRHQLAAAAVEPFLAGDDDAPTGTIVTLVGADGERSFFTDRGANARLARADLPDALLERIALVHLSGYTLFAEASRAAVLDFAGLAAQRGIPISVDPGSAAFLRACAPAFLRWTASAELCVPNADEAAVLTGTADLDAQLTALAAVYRTVVIKRGAAGAVALDAASGERVDVPAPHVDAIDTTGAGDAFVAALLVSRVRGASLQACLARAVIAGTEATTRLGGRPR